MRCEEFQTTVIALARGELAESARADALEHVAGCATCCDLLNSERLLSAELRTLAVSHAELGASAVVEENLRTAFRAQQQPSATPMFRLTWRWAVSAAAVALLVLAVYGALRFTRHPADVRSTQQPAQKSIPAMVANSQPQPRSASASSERPVERVAMKQGRRAHSKASEPLVVTSFYAMPYTEPLRPEESQRVVRVRLPQSMLVTFGLPVAQERAHEAIDADVLVGEDNVARAIRLVGNWQPTQSRDRGARPVNASFTQ